MAMHKIDRWFGITTQGPVCGDSLGGFIALFSTVGVRFSGLKRGIIKMAVYSRARGAIERLLFVLVCGRPQWQEKSES